MTMQSKKQIQNQSQSGRSMVEMLGVLAVIGVLTVTGIVGIQYAMQIYKENETLNVFSVATAGARTADLMQNYIYSCESLPCTVKPKSIISTKYDMRDTDFSTAVGSPIMIRIEDLNGYTVRIRGISKEVCESIKSGFWGETCAGVDDAGTTKYRTANCKSLKELDCSQFENANSGLIRRSALQEEISKNLKEPTVKYTQAGHSALVLYYNDKAFTDTDTFIGEENYPNPEDTDPEGSNPSHSNSDPTPPETTSLPYRPVPPTTTSTTITPTTTLKPTRPPHSVPGSTATTLKTAATTLKTATTLKPTQSSHSVSVSTAKTTLSTQEPTSSHTSLTTTSRTTVQASTTAQATVLPTTTLNPTRPPYSVSVSTATTLKPTRPPYSMSVSTATTLKPTRPPHSVPVSTATLIPQAPTSLSTGRNSDGNKNRGYDPDDPNSVENPNGEDPIESSWWSRWYEEHEDDPEVQRCSKSHPGRLVGSYNNSSLEGWQWDQDCCALANGQWKNGVCCNADNGLTTGGFARGGSGDSYNCCDGENGLNGVPAQRCCNRYPNKEHHYTIGEHGETISLCCNKGTWDPQTQTCNTATTTELGCDQLLDSWGKPLQEGGDPERLDACCKEKFGPSAIFDPYAGEGNEGNCCAGGQCPPISTTTTTTTTTPITSTTTPTTTTTRSNSTKTGTPGTTTTRPSSTPTGTTTTRTTRPNSTKTGTPETTAPTTMTATITDPVETSWKPEPPITVTTR